MQNEDLRRYLDRVEGGDVRRAREELGDPSDLAVSYSGEKHLVTPKEYAAFWYLTMLVFAVHVTMLFLAVATRTRFTFFPFNVLPPRLPDGAGAAFLLVSLAVQAFLFDAGLVLMAFFLLRRTFRRVDLPNLTFRVESSRRPSLFRAAFSAAVAVVLGVENVRANFLTVRIGSDMNPANVYSLFLDGFHSVLPFVLAFLALSFVKDVLYAAFRERTWTVAMDVVTWICGVALCVFLFAQESILGLPSDFPIEETRIDLFNVVMGRLLGLFVIMLAAIFAARAVRRIVRLRQIWGEKETERL